MNLKEYIQIGKRINKILFLVCYNILLNNQFNYNNNRIIINMIQYNHKKKEYQEKKKQKKKYKNYYMVIKKIERVHLHLKNL